MKKIAIIGSGIFVIFYLIGIFIFHDRFYFRTYINGVNCSGKTVKQVEMQMAEQVKKYKLSLTGRNDIADTIKGEDIRLYYVSDGTIRKLKEKQPAYNWLFGSFKVDSDDMQVNVTYSKRKLENIIEQLAFFQEENIVQSEEPKVSYENKKIVVKPAVYGTEMKKEKFNKVVKEALESGEDAIDIEEEKCYIDPKYDEKNKQFISAVETMEKYVSSMITYDFGSQTEVLDGKEIFSWLSMDNKFQVMISEDEQREFVKGLERKYNTLGSQRMFTTHDGRVISVPSGNYGFMISRSGEMEQMSKDIQEGKEVEREPIYAYRGYVRGQDDIGDTYVEIDLTNQKMLLYIDGNIDVETDVVTGNESSGFGTPDGVYGVTYKERDATLSGEDYNVPVKYWMPFNRNIGIHDASWRTKFGGEIYKTNGSHGCVNTPEENASKIFAKIEKGMPVIVHY